MSTEIHFNAVIEHVRRCMLKLRPCCLLDVLGRHQDTLSEIHLDAMNMQTGGKRSCEFEDALGGHELVSVKLNLEAMIDRDRCTSMW